MIMSKTLKQQSKTYRTKNIFRITIGLEHQFLIDYDFILDERLEERLLMKKLKETNIDSLTGVTDVVEIMLDKPFCELTPKELAKLQLNKELLSKEKKEDKFEWVYRTLDRYGNVFVNLSTYKQLDMERLGNHSTEYLPKTFEHERDGYIITKE